jgi:hypothetical protein
MLTMLNPANRRMDFKRQEERDNHISGLTEDGNVRIVRGHIPKGKRRPGRPKK